LKNSSIYSLSSYFISILPLNFFKAEKNLDSKLLSSISAFIN
jgi:hypothetical protein